MRGFIITASTVFKTKVATNSLKWLQPVRQLTGGVISVYLCCPTISFLQPDSLSNEHKSTYATCQSIVLTSGKLWSSIKHVGASYNFIYRGYTSRHLTPAEAQADLNPFVGQTAESGKETNSQIQRLKRAARQRQRYIGREQAEVRDRRWVTNR